MSEKRQQVYSALVDGATSGLSDDALYAFVLKRCPETPNRRIVRASLLALSDPNMRDRNILNAIYALAIKHRLDDVGGGDGQYVPLPVPEREPAKPKKSKLSLPTKREKAASKKNRPTQTQA
jgi:hypothetical protein